jgi:alpha-tubulin suppressor-like RCC1 family protein
MYDSDLGRCIRGVSCWVIALTIIACGTDTSGPDTTVASVSISPSTASLHALDATVQLTATAASASGGALPGETFTWASSAPAVASVNGAGLVTALSNGTATIRATVGGVSGEASITIEQEVGTLSLSPEEVTLTSAGETRQLTVDARDANGHPMAASPTWATTDAAVATVDSSGVVTAVGSGTADITAAMGSLTAHATVVVSISQQLTMISAGSDHTCALDSSGRAYCWGGNGYGQLGNESTTTSLEPTAVTGDLRFQSISAGYGHTCAVTRDGEGYCWGNSERGQVGDGGLGTRTAPSKVAGNHRFEVIVSGRAHTCGLTSSQVVLCWGWGSNGELGNGATANAATPDSVAGTGRYSALGGTAHTVCAVRTSGETDCWGRNNTGQVGDGTVTCTNLSRSCLGERSVPTRVSTNASFVQVSAGARINNGFGGGTACAVSDTGVGYCWGQGSSGQIGDGTGYMRTTPAIVDGGHSWRSIDVGSATSCGVTTDGIAYCWGLNGTGLIGDGTTVNRLVPVPVGGDHRFGQVSVGFDHTCALSEQGVAYCWGSNASGQLGDGSTTRRLLPIRVVALPSN